MAPVSAAIAEGDLERQQADASLISVPHTDDHPVPSSIARPTTPNTPFAACDYNLAIARLGAGPNIDPPVVLRGTAATPVGPVRVALPPPGELAMRSGFAGRPDRGPGRDNTLKGVRRAQRRGIPMFRRRRGEAAGSGAPAADPAATPSSGRQPLPDGRELVSFGDDFFIQNDHGERVFKVDGKALRVRDTLVFRDMQGNEVCKIQEQVARVRDSMEIEGPDSHALAMVHKAMITPIRDRYVVKVGDGPDLEIQGNILDHEYRIGNVATVSKKWFRVRDSYGVEIAPGQNDVLILAAAVCIDQMAH